MERAKQVKLPVQTSMNSYPKAKMMTHDSPWRRADTSFASCRKTAVASKWCLSAVVAVLVLSWATATAAKLSDTSQAVPVTRLRSTSSSSNRTNSQQRPLLTNATQRRRRPSNESAPQLPSLPLDGAPRDHMLKSSKDALIVTKKSYLRKDWCKTEPLVQRVREPGCVTRTVVNRFCYGQCNSFYIPKNARAEMDATAFKSCAFCKPKRFRWIGITLRCPGRHPPYKRKRIQRIKKCKCISEILQ